MIAKLTFFNETVSKKKKLYFAITVQKKESDSYIHKIQAYFEYNEFIYIQLIHKAHSFSEDLSEIIE